MHITTPQSASQSAPLILGRLYWEHSHNSKPPLNQERRHVVTEGSANRKKWQKLSENTRQKRQIFCQNFEELHTFDRKNFEELHFSGSFHGYFNEFA